MKPEKILKLAIEKAVKNGWWHPLFSEMKWEATPAGVKSIDGNCWVELEGIIFSHDFAKAFWGSCKFRYRKVKLPTTLKIDHPKATVLEWQYHLQQMVLEKDPLLYLAKFLK